MRTSLLALLLAPAALACAGDDPTAEATAAASSSDHATSSTAATAAASAATTTSSSSEGPTAGTDGTTGAHESTAGSDGTTSDTATGGVPEIPAHPFASHTFDYAPGAILPARPEADLDAATADFYDTWKDLYLRAGCGDGRYFVKAAIDPDNRTVSEAHGYGMLLTAIMAGHDPDAQLEFDGLYRFFRDHPSAASPDLMAWYQDKTCADAMGQDSASDGDLDIAFALLLADRQWGSCGAIDYRAEALAVIAAIAEHELDETHAYVLLGDWATADVLKYHQATRSSDFITDHFRSFAAAAGPASWEGLLDATYELVAVMQATHAPATGLLPDFIRAPLATPKPAESGFLEGPTDGAYAYNACRDPWRLATDFLVSGDPRPRAAVQAMTAWIRQATADDPAQIRAGYRLDGAPQQGSGYLTMAFVAPFGPAAMVDADHQTWLDAIWDESIAADPEGYYEDTLRLLSMIVMSGNWWPPEASPSVCDP
ncbi:MAG TPA: glycosyl hydrolase family 8 [Nannocystaceae bacterium]|nr:glycosyl hydrolase family 8 [Nannocystaceae bacterium]